MSSTKINKDKLIELLNNEIKISDDNTENIMTIATLLSEKHIKFKIKQGWKVNFNKEFNREAIVYIEVFIEHKKYIIEINNNISLSRKLNANILKSKPSDKYINKYRQRNKGTKQTFNEQTS